MKVFLQPSHPMCSLCGVMLAFADRMPNDSMLKTGKMRYEHFRNPSRPCANDGKVIELTCPTASSYQEKLG